jgi:hypothetical protein
MARILSFLALFFLASSPAVAQDMPLSQILIDGEGWKKAEGKPEKPKDVHAMQSTVELRGSGGWMLGTVSPDGRTVYKWQTGDRMIFAGQKLRDPKPLEIAANLAPYCPLRPTPGKPLDVTGMTVDRDGRIYAVTYAGIQVFDPTGRLCGVMDAPPQGDWLWAGVLPQFEGDKLTLWVGDTKYERKLKTAGVK